MPIGPEERGAVQRGPGQRGLERHDPEPRDPEPRDPESEPFARPARVALLGLGLIGGSIAHALGALPAYERPYVVAWSPGDAGARGGAASAARDDVVDEALDDPATAVLGADLVVLAMPASAVGGWLERLADPDDLGRTLHAGASLTDVASTKAAIVARADALGLRFVGGHPMAGREASGYAAATADLFEGRPWVLVPGAASGPHDTARVTWLARTCGAAPFPMDALAHDTAVAAISHLPLVVSAALVEAIVGAGEGTGASERADWPAAGGLAATGWAGMTRLARGDAAMGAAILATNAPPVAARVRDLVSVLEQWIATLERDGGPDEAALRARLDAARRRLARDEPGP
jgi:prephenate dehydrogenase